VAKFSLRRFEDQAKASIVLGIVACVSLVVQAAMVFRHVDWSDVVIIYGNPSRRYLVLATTAISFLIGVSALGLGLNSAGQRRNEQPKLSWAGFFLGAGVICLTVIIFMLFYLRSEYIGLGK
jgi:tellurite resistance protein TehA-like permease